MEFVNVRELRKPKEVWEKLANDGEIVLTNNGKPTALLLDLQHDDLEDIMKAVRSARAIKAFHNIRAEAERRGFYTEEEIEAEIAQSRAERRQQENSEK